MRWKIKQQAVVGLIRYRTVFTWTPTEINGIKYWLESVDVKERYCAEEMCGQYTNLKYYTYDWEIIGLDDRP